MGKQFLKQIRAKKGEARTEHGEVKVNVNSSLTPTVKNNFDAAATRLDISRSELIERLGQKGVEWLVKMGRSEVVKEPSELSISEYPIRLTNFKS